MKIWGILVWKYVIIILGILGLIVEKVSVEKDLER